MNLESLLAKFLAAVITITLHEFVKALVSTKLGDPLPKRDGRLTVNPLKHIDPIGFIVMVYFGFGWGKPVETASIYYKDRKKGTLITYIVPSVVNLLFGIIIMLVIAIAPLPSKVNYYMQIIALFNLRNAFFNIVPVYPLDGAKVLSAMRNPNQVIGMVNNQMFYQMALIMFMLWGIVSSLIDPFCYAIMDGIANIYR